MEKKLSGSLTVSDGQDEAHIPDVPRPILEALYATVTNAKDRMGTNRRLPSILKIEDIEQLLSQLSQWSKPYDPIAKKVKISVQTLSPERKNVGVKRSEYNSLSHFKEELPGKTEQIGSLVLDFEFLSKGGADGKMNQYELRLEVRGEVRRVFYSISENNPLGGRLYRNSDDRSASISVRYSDVIVARGLMGVVENWYENLPQREFPNIGRLRVFLHSSEIYEEVDVLRSLFRICPIIFGSAFASLVGPWVKGFTGVVDDIPFWVMMISICSLVFYLCFGVVLKKFDSLEFGYNVPLIEITSGDQRRVERFERRKAEREGKLNFWVQTVSVGFVVSVLASLAVIFVF